MKIPSRRIRSEAVGPRFNSVLKSERGNVESALTIIPLMLLFLSVMQLGLGVYGRVTSDQMTQGSVARQAMGMATSDALTQGSSSSSTDPFMEGFASEMQNVGSVTAIPLPGGGSLDLGTAMNGLPSISPLLPEGDHMTSSGLAVQE